MYSYYEPDREAAATVASLFEEWLGVRTKQVSRVGDPKYFRPRVRPPVKGLVELDMAGNGLGTLRAWDTP